MLHEPETTFRSAIGTAVLLGRGTGSVHDIHTIHSPAWGVCCLVRLASRASITTVSKGWQDRKLPGHQLLMSGTQPWCRRETRLASRRRHGDGEPADPRASSALGHAGGALPRRRESAVLWNDGTRRWVSDGKARAFTGASGRDERCRKHRDRVTSIAVLAIRRPGATVRESRPAPGDRTQSLASLAARAARAAETGRRGRGLRNPASGSRSGDRGRQQCRPLLFLLENRLAATQRRLESVFTDRSA